MLRLLAKTVVTAAAVWAATAALSGIYLTGNGTGPKALTLIVVAVVLGLVNAVIKPIVKFFSLPLIFLTLGLFTLVVNALLLKLVAWITHGLGFGFHVDGFWTAVGGSLIISVVSWLLHVLIPDRKD